MVIASLEKSFAVNPFANEIVVDKKPEIVEKINIKGISEKVNYVFEEYKKSCLAHPAHLRDSPPNFYNEVLAPLEIDLLLQSIIKSNLENEPCHLAGFIISRLINDSYKSGNNNFILTTNDCGIIGLFYNVKGSEKNPVIASIFGNVGNRCGCDSEYCILDVKGNAGHQFGFESKNCVYIINENVSILCGEKSIDCTYNIYGTIDTCLDDSARDSTFNIRNQELYQCLCKIIHPSNTLQLLDKNENIIMERKRKS